ncbi:MAG: AlbA family DNA-binding domain-containing protein [Ktedonobacteraceae bacterium]
MNTIDDLPKKLEVWTYDTVVNLVAKYKDEPSIFDFKEVLNATHPAKGDHAMSIRRTTCSMANAGGGYILFGVLDRKKPASTLEARIPGIPLETDLRKKFQEKIASLQRPVHFDVIPSPILLPTNSQRGVFVVSIPQSPLRPHVDPSTGVFYRRADGGNADHMDFYEVREQMMYTEERLRKVRLFRLEIAQYQQITITLMQLGELVITNLLRYDTSAFKTILADICGFIPSSSNLLQQLLEIPITAKLINDRLTREVIPGISWNGSPAERARPILENHTHLDRLLTLCTQELENIFGSLE